MEQPMLVSLYDPALLLDSLCQKLNLRNDSALALAVGISPSAISKMRARKAPVCAGFLVVVSELTCVNTRTLRALMGDARKLYRLSDIGMQSIR